MRIDTALNINHTTAELISNNVKLELNTPGRAIITAITDTDPQSGQAITLDAKLNGTNWRPVIWGYIDTVQPLAGGAWQILARELAATLNRRIPINLRQPLPADVLQTLSDQTGAVFVLPESDWTKTQIPRYQHLGGGYGALDNMLKTWGVTDGIWQQQTDGRIYVGERKNSATGAKTIDLPASIFDSLSTLGGTLPLTPRIRPGISITINGGQPQIIHSIEIAGDTMRLQWRSIINSTTLRALT
ncbi:hypothetical protein [Oceanobacter sp. 4_MG-2023]|uniref:hypothetical protein n=1 Tax=Oceanobacter sp. 4_MG-2023 TaxID=3062623 RepID=UPI0027352898|nr:hypothetical protein [Oceanobacter sp. 4_MG-2023]MDP2548910.1 hypothetical protein [Oceanobacter sp. 4_MG-2023]